MFPVKGEGALVRSAPWQRGRLKLRRAGDDGKMVAVMHGGKTGYVYVHDRKSVRADSGDRHVVRARKYGDDLLMHCAVNGFVSLA